jgi:hypothetical protein
VKRNGFRVDFLSFYDTHQTNNWIKKYLTLVIDEEFLLSKKCVIFKWQAFGIHKAIEFGAKRALNISFFSN